MPNVHAAPPMAPAATAAPGREAAARQASLPASPSFLQREEIPASATFPDGSLDHADALRIRVWYLDDVLTRAEPKFIPDVATLKQLLPDKEANFPTSASPTSAADHFADIPYSPPPTAAARAQVPSRPLTATGASSTRLDTATSWSDAASCPSIALRPASPTHPGGHPAWVSVKAPSRAELTEVLDWLPIHVLTRRRILGIMSFGDDGSSDSSSDTDNDGVDSAAGNATTTTEPAYNGRVVGAARRSRQNTRTASPSQPSTGRTQNKTKMKTRSAEERAIDGADGSGDDDQTHPHRSAARDNFLEYFPAHGYAVLCLQAVPLPQGESTRRGATPKEEFVAHGPQTPSTPVVALAFESTLFTFTRSRFGGEGDVRLIVANHVASPTARGATRAGAAAAAAAHVTAITTLSNSAASFDREQQSREDARESLEAAMNESTTVAFHNTTSPVGQTADTGKAARALPREASGSAAMLSPATVSHGMHAAPPPLAYATTAPPSSPPPASASSPSRFTASPNTTSSANWNAATAISVVCSSLISAIVAYMQQSTRSLMMEADQLDELVLQILPSRVDQDDMLVRTKSIRNLIAAFHIDALQKERVLKQLLLPAMRQTPLSQSTQAIERYQRSLSSVRSTVIKLRKGRDIVNMASMTLISGVSARLLTHCNFMDYLNHVQTQIAVVVMPIAVIPGIFATNVKVPWSELNSMVPFYCILSITLALMAIGVAVPLYKFFMYRTPKALAPLE